MPNYRRAYQPGGTFFLTAVTHQRAPLFQDSSARKCLHQAIAATRHDRPFDLVALILLLDHLHLILTLPEGDSDFSTRIAAIKARFTHVWLAGGGTEQAQSESRTEQEYRGVWQKRFWEHCVTGDADLVRCLDYMHYNPVKHGLATCPHAWEWSSFHRFVREGRYERDWCCACDGAIKRATPADIPGAEMD